MLKWKIGRTGSISRREEGRGGYNSRKRISDPATKDLCFLTVWGYIAVANAAQKLVKSSRLAWKSERLERWSRIALIETACRDEVSHHGIAGVAPAVRPACEAFSNHRSPIMLFTSPDKSSPTLLASQLRSPEVIFLVVSSSFHNDIRRFTVTSMWCSLYVSFTGNALAVR